MSKPMTSPEDHKAAQCPLCSAKVQLPSNYPGWMFHPHVNCVLDGKSFPIAQWNTRPREKALEGVLRGLLDWFGTPSLSEYHEGSKIHLLIRDARASLNEPKETR